METNDSFSKKSEIVAKEVDYQQKSDETIALSDDNSLQLNDKIQPEQSGGEAKHLAWIDVIRSLAIFLVVFLHVSESVISYTVEGLTPLSSFFKFYASAVFVSGRISVPLFLLLSGFLLLSRQYDAKSTLRFYKRNLLPLIISYQLCLIIYFCYFAIAEKVTYEFVYILKALLFLDYANPYLMHIWYLPMIIGLYFCIPFVAMVLQKFSVKALIIPLILAYIVFFLFPLYNDFINTPQGIVDANLAIYPQLDLSFFGGGYGFYLILGYYIKVAKKPVLKNYTRIIFFALLYFFTIIFELLSIKDGEVDMLWYDFFTLPAMSVLLFNIIKTIFENKTDLKPFRFLAKFSFGIYLYHILFMKLFLKINLTLGLFPKSILIFILTFASTILSVFLLNLIPKVGKILFVIKDNKKTLEKPAEQTTNE